MLLIMALTEAMLEWYRKLKIREIVIILLIVKEGDGREACGSLREECDGSFSAMPTSAAACSLRTSDYCAS